MATNTPSENRAEQAQAQADAARVERDVALNAAVDESLGRDAAERREIDARIAANQNAARARELETHRDMLRSELTEERVAASNNAFGFYLMTGLVLAALLIAGLVYYYWRGPQSDVTINAASPNPPVSTVVTPPPTAAPPPVIVTPPASRPPVVNVTPPPAPAPEVHNNITVPSTPAPNNGSSGSTPDNGSNNNNSNTTQPDNTNGGNSGSSSGSGSS